MNRRRESIEDENLDSIRLLGAFTQCEECSCSGWKSLKQRAEFTHSDANVITKASLTTNCNNCNHSLSRCFLKIFFCEISIF